MLFKPEQLLKITPALKGHEACLIGAAAKYDISTPLRASHWIAQMAHESAGFTTMVESLNYSAKALKTLFGRHRISLADADKFGRTADHPAHQNALANILYGGEFGRKNLGNTEPGDGWKFRGRGYKQITGRDNYTRGSQRVFGDDRLVENPELAELPATAALLAGDFWNQKKLNKFADKDDIVTITQLINGGQNGIEGRVAWLRKAKAALGA